MRTFYFLVFVIFFNPISYGQCFTKIACGESHVVATKTNNSLWGWGWGDSGSLANNSSFNEYEPFLMNATSNWSSISAGRYNSFGVKTDGTLWGTGGNLNGALGINSSNLNTTSLVQIGSATNWRQVSASSSFTLATKTDNTLWGWGQNDLYQMGNGTCCSDRLSPGQIGTDTDWKLAIACTSARVGLAIKTNGTLWGWGGNGSGLIGESDISSRPYPTQIGTDSNWETLATGAAHALALKTDGTLWAWGVGFNGQTGDTLPPTFF
jgi:alpha-tubulin suppressor-like RCC1 family protein